MRVSKKLNKIVMGTLAGLMLVTSSIGSISYAGSTDTPRDNNSTTTGGNTSGTETKPEEKPPEDTGGGATDDYSFYKIASAASTYLNTALSPKGDGVNPEWTTVNSNGNLLGYTDPDITKGVSTWFWGQATNSSGTRSYSSLGKGSVHTSSSTSGKGLLSYAYYGAALTALGIDEQKPKAFSVSRKVGGFLMLGVYYLSTAVDVVFEWAIKVVKMANPFRLFANIAGTAMGTTAPAPLLQLAGWISTWYNTLVNIGWMAIIPLFLAFLIANLVLFKRRASGGEKWRMIKKVLIRMWFLVAGIPMLGTLYTAGLDSMSQVTSKGGVGSTQVILGTFVDFESWAENHRLSLPSQARVEWNEARSRPTVMSQVVGRNNALAINALSYGTQFMPGGTLDGSAVSSWNTTALNGGSRDGNDVLTVKSLLERYMNGDFYHSSDWETSVKAGIDTMGKKDSDKKKKLDEMALQATDPKNYESDKAKVTKDHPFFNTNGGSIIYDYGSGRLTTTSSPNAGISTNASGTPLSAIGMYNYLNTNFQSDSMVIYSPLKSASEHIKASHHSVNLVGSGMIAFLYYVNAFLLLLVFTVLGFGYAMGMMISAIKRTIKMIFEVPFGLLGSIQAIAKCVIYTVCGLLEIIGTMFVYMFVQGFFLSLPELVEVPFTAVSAAIGSDGGILVILMLFVSIAIMLWFLIMALRLRKEILRGLNEWAKSVIDSLFGVQTNADLSDNPSNLGHAGKALMAAGGGGLLGWAANKALNKEDGDKNKGMFKAVGSGKNDENEESKKNLAKDGEPDTVDKSDGDGTGGGINEDSNAKQIQEKLREKGTLSLPAPDDNSDGGGDKPDGDDSGDSKSVKPNDNGNDMDKTGDKKSGKSGKKKLEKSDKNGGKSGDGGSSESSGSNESDSPVKEVEASDENEAVGERRAFARKAKKIAKDGGRAAGLATAAGVGATMVMLGSDSKGEAMAHIKGAVGKNKVEANTDSNEVASDKVNVKRKPTRSKIRSLDVKGKETDENVSVTTDDNQQGTKRKHVKAVRAVDASESTQTTTQTAPSDKPNAGTVPITIGDRVKRASKMSKTELAVAGATATAAVVGSSAQHAKKKDISKIADITSMGTLDSRGQGDTVQTIDAKGGSNNGVDRVNVNEKGTSGIRKTVVNKNVSPNNGSGSSGTTPVMAGNTRGNTKQQNTGGKYSSRTMSVNSSSKGGGGNVHETNLINNNTRGGSTYDEHRINVLDKQSSNQQSDVRTIRTNKRQVDNKSTSNFVNTDNLISEIKNSNRTNEYDKINNVKNVTDRNSRFRSGKKELPRFRDRKNNGKNNKPRLRKRK